MQGLMAPTNTQGTNMTPPPSLMPSTPSSHSVASSFLNGITQGHNIMGGGASHGSSTLNSPRSSLYSESFTAMRPMMDFVNPTTNQDSRMYPAVSERDPNIASGSGHQVADAVHESIVETLTGAAAQRAAVTGGIFQVPHQSFDISTPEIPKLELSLAPPEKELFLLPPPAQPSSSAAAAAASYTTPAQFREVEREQAARVGHVSKEFLYADLKSVTDFLKFIRSTADPLITGSLVTNRIQNIEQTDKAGYNDAFATMREETSKGDFRAKYPQFKVSKSQPGQPGHARTPTLDERKYALWVYDRKASSKK
jgi:hypothetical protein